MKKVKESVMKKLEMLNKKRASGKLNKQLPSLRRVGSQNVISRSGLGLKDVVPTIQAYLRTGRACLVFEEAGDVVVMPQAPTVDRFRGPEVPEVPEVPEPEVPEVLPDTKPGVKRQSSGKKSKKLNT